MDPLSITASVTALLECCIQIYKGIEAIKNGSDERENLLSELRLLHSFLHGLKGRIDLAQGDELWMQPIRDLDQPDGVFSRLYSALNQLMAKLGAKLLPEDERVATFSGKKDSLRRRFVNGVRWSLNAQEVKDVVQRIEGLKNTISLALGQSNLILATQTGENVTALKKGQDERRFQGIIEWLSPIDARKAQADKRGVPHTGSWFFHREEFHNWISGTEPLVWCYGIPGAGKTTLASTAVDKVRELHEGHRVLVMSAFCKYDEPSTQSLGLLLASLLKQALQISSDSMPELEAAYDRHRREQSHPSANEVCTLLQLALNRFDKAFLVLDGLDELKSSADREQLLNYIQNLDGLRLMLMSRRYDDIACRFGRSSTLAYQCDSCEVRLNRVYYFCKRCHVDKCPSCYEADGACCDAGCLEKKNMCGSIKIAAHPDDLENFILQRIQGSNLLAKWVLKRDGLQDAIMSTVKDKAKEMFLLARFYMDELEKQMTIKQVLNALGRLPVKLDENYDQAMDRVSELREPLRQMVRNLLMWVACAKRPLKTPELEHALAIESDVEDIDEDDVTDISLLTSKCAGLVEVDDTKCVRLTHETVKNYFRRNLERWFPQGESAIAGKCLIYLRMEAFSQGACSGKTEEADYQDRCRRYPFLPYASVYWGYHATHQALGLEDKEKSIANGDQGTAQTEDVSLIIPASMRFLRSKGNVETAVQAMWHNDSRWDAKQDAQALHLTAWFGLPLQAAKLLSKGADVNAKDSLGTTPLMYASARGNAEVTEILLHSNADTSVLCHRGSTALHRAAFIGRPRIVKQILKYSQISINTLSRQRLNRTALTLAIVKGHMNVVKALLTHKSIDVNLESRGGQTALSLAATVGHLDIVNLLLECKAQMDHQDTYGYTALSQAGEHGHVEIVKCLMDHGANPNLRDTYGGTALLRAVDQGKPVVFRTLISRGAEYTFRDFRGRTVLHGAAINNRHNMLRMLLEKKHHLLEVDVRGDAGETPLHDAARCGRIKCVEVLLAFGARTDIMDNEKRTPVSLAMMENQLGVLEMLKGARESVSETGDQKASKTCTSDPKELLAARARPHSIHNEPLETYTRPFYRAVQHDDAATLEAMLPASPQERARFLDADDSTTGASALHMAVRRGDLDIVEMLLKAGANPNSTDHYGYAPLHPAARQNRVDILQSLVNHGADLDISNAIERTPLKVAVVNKSKEAALVLVERGAVVGGDSPHLQMLLRWAAELGNLQVVRRLVPLGPAFMLKGRDGRNAFEVARDEGHEEIAAFLLRAMDEFRGEGQKRDAA